MLQPTAGKWYISLVCEFCKRRIILYPDLSHGKSDLKSSRISMNCPKCQTETSSAVEHYLHPKKRRSGELTAPYGKQVRAFPGGNVAESHLFEGFIRLAAA